MPKFNQLKKILWILVLAFGGLATNAFAVDLTFSNNVTVNVGGAVVTIKSSSPTPQVNIVRVDTNDLFVTAPGSYTLTSDKDMGTVPGSGVTIIASCSGGTWTGATTNTGGTSVETRFSPLSGACVVGGGGSSSGGGSSGGGGGGGGGGGSGSLSSVTPVTPVVAVTPVQPATTSELSAQLLALQGKLKGLLSKSTATSAKPITKGLAFSSSMFTTNLSTTANNKKSDVVNLQKKLMLCLGQDSGLTGATGLYGSVTKKAVMKFQIVSGIEPTGTVGPQTRKALNDNSCGKGVSESSITPTPVATNESLTNSDLTASALKNKAKAKLKKASMPKKLKR